MTWHQGRKVTYWECSSSCIVIVVLIDCLMSRFLWYEVLNFPVYPSNRESKETVCTNTVHFTFWVWFRQDYSRLNWSFPNGMPSATCILSLLLSTLFGFLKAVIWNWTMLKASEQQKTQRFNLCNGDYWKIGRIAISYVVSDINNKYNLITYPSPCKNKYTQNPTPPTRRALR